MDGRSWLLTMAIHVVIHSEGDRGRNERTLAAENERGNLNVHLRTKKNSPRSSLLNGITGISREFSPCMETELFESCYNKS